MKLSSLYVDLYEQKIRETGLTNRQISSLCSVSHQTISNFRSGKHPPTYETLVEIGDAIKIKRLEAFIAVEVLEDIETYNHVGMSLLASLVKPLGECLAGTSSPITDDFRENDLKAFTERLVRATHDTVLSRERALAQFRQSAASKSD